MFNITGFSWLKQIIFTLFQITLCSILTIALYSFAFDRIGFFTYTVFVISIFITGSVSSLLYFKKESAKHSKIITDIIDSVSDVVLIKNYKGEFVHCNKTVAELYKTTPREMIGKDDLYFTGNKEQADFFRENICSIMNKFETKIVYEETTDANTGEVRHFHSTKIPFRDASNQLKILVAAKDITEIAKLKEVADRNKKRLEHVLEVSQEGLWEWNTQTNQVHHNHQWELITGVQRSDNTFQEFEKCIYTEDQEKVRKALENLIQHNEPYSIEFRMKRPDGKTIWVWDRGTIAEYDDNGEPLWLVGIVLDITDEKLNQQKVVNLAYYDQLTGLLNRTHLGELVKNITCDNSINQTYNALLFLDLDHFKFLNDSHGHDIGDRLLQEVANRLISCVGTNADIARFGGDEFVLLLTGLSATSEQEATMIANDTAQKILRSFHQAFRLGDLEHSCSTSIGITIFSSGSKCLDELVKQADMAMYGAKNAGRNAVRFFSPEMQTAAQNRALLEADLRRDIAAEKMQLYYQPQINSQGKITGVETLLRWQHEVRGMISPAEFIPIAEISGLIIELGDWVLKSACKELSYWAMDPVLSKLTISVNISPAQLHSNNFVQSVIRNLEETGAPANKLKLEITESILVRNMDESITKMSRLRSQGVRFSLDDFGTGYSSLSYLKRLPLDQLKIDQSFVRDILQDPNDAAIAEMIVVLGKTLGLSVIAEGVETEPQRSKLKEIGCHSFQGYLFAYPMPLKEFRVFANSFNNNCKEHQMVT